MRRLVFHSLAASAIYLLAGIGLEWASHTYRVEWLRFDAPDILLFFFPLALPFESFSRAVGWYALAPGMVILGCWLSGFLICFLSSLWIRGLIHRKQRAAYLTKSACAFLVFAALLIGCGNRDRVWLNLQMRNADQVRADCAKLLEKRRSTVKEELMEMRIPSRSCQHRSVQSAPPRRSPAATSFRSIFSRKMVTAVLGDFYTTRTKPT